MKVKLRKFRSSDPLKDGLLSALRSEGCKNQGWLAGPVWMVYIPRYRGCTNQGFTAGGFAQLKIEVC